MGVAASSFESLVPLLQQSITSSPGHRGAAAQALTLLARRSEEAPLQAQAVKCAGPLVRALGDKSADQELHHDILAALVVLLDRAGIKLRPLVPALLTEVVKTISEAMKDPEWQK